MKILSENDERAPDMSEAWEQYRLMHRLQPHADTDATKRAFAFAYLEGHKAGRRLMADRARSALAMTVDALGELAKDPNKETA